ncbi:short chain dehydrogenase/reductase [Apiospora hydei]|uniref:Short chain dehydrogenase/reductase n=1 Tax=Apiospora hydei TaxID=1337664 RepID=A0ABR1X4Z7_9PEZI
MATGQANDLSAGALFDVSHVTAVVTGGATGIGLMITQALQSNGAKVYITGRRQEVLDQTVKMYSTGPGQIIALRGTKQRPARHERRQGHLEHFLRSSEEQWLETMQTNVVGAYFMSMAFLPLLAKGGPRRSRRTPARKRRRRTWSRMLATIFKDVQVRVNVIAPGLFPSEMTAGKSGEDNKSTLDQSKATNPTGRLGEERDMAATILFLAGRGGAFYNGQIVYPDGGSTLIQPAVAN